MGWEFAALLLTALVLGIGLSLLQHRAYSRAVNQMAVAWDSPNVVLVSGRGRGIVRGSVVIFAVDRRARRIMGARAMKGASVFARFASADELTGSLSSAPQRARDRHTQKAAEQAVAQFKNTVRAAKRSGNSGNTSKGTP